MTYKESMATVKASCCSPDQVKAVLDALEQLALYVTNNPNRYNSRNPYGVPAIENALRAIAHARGRRDYVDALSGLTDRFMEEYQEDSRR